MKYVGIEIGQLRESRFILQSKYLRKESRIRWLFPALHTCIYYAT